MDVETRTDGAVIAIYRQDGDDIMRGNELNEIAVEKEKTTSPTSGFS